MLEWLETDEKLNLGQYFYNTIENKKINSDCVLDFIKKDNGLDNIFYIVCNCPKCSIKVKK